MYKVAFVLSQVSNIRAAAKCNPKLVLKSAKFLVPKRPHLVPTFQDILRSYSKVKFLHVYLIPQRVLSLFWNSWLSKTTYSQRYAQRLPKKSFTRQKTLKNFFVPTLSKKAKCCKTDAILTDYLLYYIKNLRRLYFYILFTMFFAYLCSFLLLCQKMHYFQTNLPVGQNLVIILIFLSSRWRMTLK